MADRLTAEQRRRNMQNIRSKDSQIEILLRRELWQRGIRYRKNVRGIFGCPDIAFKGIKIAVFCDSEFWHGYDWENRKDRIKSNREYWIPKIERNMARDVQVTEHLEEDGWIVLRFWGRQIQKETSVCADIIEKCVNERKAAKAVKAAKAAKAVKADCFG